MNTPNTPSRCSRTFARPGVDADLWSVCSKRTPTSFTAVVQRVRAGTRLQAAGYPTRLEFPEAVNADAAWNFVQAAQGDLRLWPYVGLISWHLYGSNTQRPALLAFAQTKGIPTGQTEFLSATSNDLIDDLTLGNASYWEKYGINGGPADANAYVNVALSGSSFSFSSSYFRFRQFFHYVRPGAVRVAATSVDPAVRAVA